MPRPGQIFESLLLLLLAAVLAWLGVSVPVHFRSVSPAVIRAAGEGTRSVEDLTRDYMLTGQVGPVRLLWEADIRLPSTPAERRRMQELVQRHPHYWHSGGPSPYYEAFLALVKVPGGPEHERNVIQMVLPRAHRQLLAEYLSGSSNLAVQDLLALRAATGWRHFMPVQSAAGHPLDASLLTLALLVQSDSLRPALRREVQLLAAAVQAQDRGRQDELEDLLLAVLSLGRQMDWVQLTALFQLFDDSGEAVAAGRRMSMSPSKFTRVYAAALLLGDFGPLSNYLDAHGDEALEALDVALPAGQGAVEALIEGGKTLYHPPLLVRWLDRPLTPLRDAFLLGFALDHPLLALDAKIVLLLLAGYCLAMACMRILSMAGTIPGLGVTHPLIIAANAVGAVMFTFLLWVLVEPNLLRFADRSITQLHLDFGISMPLESLDSQQMTPNPIDQATILVLLLFFFLQLVVYVFGLLKIVEVRRQQVTPRKKLELLTNEENLFDLGLYVGLGGTVASLVMLAMDIVQASLIAAYSSTLFGIIFAAVLKIVHVRPYRRKLILQDRDEPAPPPHVAPAQL